MVRTVFVNPFKSHHVDEFPGVLVPLDETTHRNSVQTPRASIPTSESEKESKNEDPSSIPGRPDSDASSGIINHGMTVAALKAEIVADVAASETDTPYDRRFSTIFVCDVAIDVGNLETKTSLGKAKVINRALQDMGMGKYQWQLFALCGGGWMADNLWLQVSHQTQIRYKANLYV